MAMEVRGAQWRRNHSSLLNVSPCVWGCGASPNAGAWPAEHNRGTWRQLPHPLQRPDCGFDGSSPLPPNARSVFNGYNAVSRAFVQFSQG